MPLATTIRPSSPRNRDFVRVGRSRIHGKGVFAKRKIPKGTRIIEYEGERVPLVQMLVQTAEGSPGPVYIFHLNDTTVIDGARSGNDARFVNHSCDPNCEAYVFDDRVYFYAMRDIVRGEELSFDYKLGSPVGARAGKSVKLLYECHCGSPNCRGTMIARPKRARPRTVPHH